MDVQTDEVLLAALRLSMAVSVHAADEIGELSPVQLRALTVLNDQEGANLVQLAEGMRVTVSTASRLVDRLVAARLADRRPSPFTRREISLSLSEQGRAILERYDAIRLAELRARLAHLDPADRDDVVRALQLLTRSGQPAEPLAAPA